MSAWSELPSLEAAARRALPEEDPVLDGLGAEPRALLARSWAARAHAELGAAAVFAAVSHGLFGVAASREILWLAARAVCDELRHSEICRYVARRYGGEEPERTDAPDVGTPRFGRTSAETSRLFHAVVNCCINESIGSAMLHVCLEQATAPLARAATRELLADDIDHARIGWAVLASPRLPPGFRAELERALPTLVRIGRDPWLAFSAKTPADPPIGHGCLSAADLRAVVDEALLGVVLPGFEHVGIATEAARRVIGAETPPTR
jgi:hypothetical protein